MSADLNIKGGVMLCVFRWRFMRFLTVGGVGVCAYYIVLYSLTEFAGLWYLASAIIAFALNWVINFVLQKVWTFQNKKIETIRAEVIQFSLMKAGLFFANTGFLCLLVEYRNIQYLPAQLILTAVSTPVIYIITRKIFTK